MTTEWTWRDIAAVWGAGLSTLIWLGRLLPIRPTFHLAPGERPLSDMTLRIVNPSRETILVRDIARIRLGGDREIIGLFTRKTPVCDIGRSGGLLVTVPGEGALDVKVNCIDAEKEPNARWIVIFVWRGGSWIFPLGLPVPVYISARRAALLNKGAQNEGAQQ